MKLITVHGTHAAADEDEGSKWWQRGSEFHRLLETHYGEPIAIEPFHWNGLNSERARRQAGDRLYKKLRDISEPFHIMGHSHGGSVIVEALRTGLLKRDKLENLRSWTCVGTPFLRFDPNGFILNRVGFLWRVVLVAQLVLLFSILIYFSAVLLTHCHYFGFSSCAARNEVYLYVGDAKKKFGGEEAELRRKLAAQKAPLTIWKALRGEVPLRPVIEDSTGKQWLARFDWSFMGDEYVSMLEVQPLWQWLLQESRYHLSLTALAFLFLLATSRVAQRRTLKLMSPRFVQDFRGAFFGRSVFVVDARDEAISGLRLGNGLGQRFINGDAFIPVVNAIGVVLSVIATGALMLLVMSYLLEGLVHRKWLSTADVMIMFAEDQPIFVPLVLAVVSVSLSLLTYGITFLIGRSMITPLFAFLANRQISSALRNYALGAGVSGERSAGVTPLPREFDGKAEMLPETLSKELLAMTRAYSVDFVDKVRGELRADTEGRLADIIGGMTGRELVHNCYFFVPGIVTMMAKAIRERG